MCGHPPGTHCATDTRGRCIDAEGAYNRAYPPSVAPTADPLSSVQYSHRAPTAPRAVTTPAQQRAEAAARLTEARKLVAMILAESNRRNQNPYADPRWAAAIQDVHHSNVALTLLDHPELADP